VANKLAHTAFESRAVHRQAQILDDQLRARAGQSADQKQDATPPIG
jgi:hypothetical protein